MFVINYLLLLIKYVKYMSYLQKLGEYFDEKLSNICLGTFVHSFFICIAILVTFSL